LRNGVNIMSVSNVNERELILSSIKSLEAQLRVLRARIESSITPQTTVRSFADLHGCLEGKAETIEEEIDAILYKEISYEDED
jgi:hypothetical protein